MRLRLAIVALLSWFARPLPGQPSLWPPPRAGHAIAYHEQIRMTVMYGDADSLLWAWDGSRWRTFDGPPGRKHLRLAYDAARDRLVLFGGATRTEVLGDTWEWDGTRWARVATDGPGERLGHAMAYDPVRRRVVLFGGASRAGLKGDTWEWDGTRWTKLADSGPAARGEAGFTFDPHTQRLILSGGVAPGQSPLVLRDTWAWNGQRWEQLGDSGPRRFGPLGQDPLTGVVMRVAGESDSTVVGDAWQWSGSWTRVAGAEIPARQTHDMSLDTHRKRLVVFGGSRPNGGTLADLWEWDGRQWREVKRP